MGQFLINSVLETSLDAIFEALIIISFTSLFLYVRRKIATKKFLTEIVAGLFFTIALTLIFVITTTSDSDRVTNGFALLAITGVFFGLIPLIMTLVIGILLQAFIFNAGGNNLLLIIIAMTLTSGLGLIWHYVARDKFKKIPSFLNYLIFGLVVQAVNVGLIAIFTEITGKDFLLLIFPLLVVYPLVIAVVSYIEKLYFLFVNTAHRDEEFLIQRRAAVNATTRMELYALDTDLKYIFFNDFHRDQIKLYYGQEPVEGGEYLSLISNAVIRERLQETFEETLGGIDQVKTIEVEDKPGKFLREHYTPIKDPSGNIIGITVFSEEVTELKRHEANITFLSYHDMLTKLKNRRYFYEQLDMLKTLQEEIIVVYFDVNSLKIMNDAFGHDTGDELLRIVAKLIRKHFGAYGDISRIGGDEIIALIRNQEYAFIEQNIIAFEKEVLTKELKSVQISVSTGVSIAKTGRDLNRAILVAEDEMYNHKLRVSIQHRSDILKNIYEQVLIHNKEYEANYELVTKYAQQLGMKLGLSNYELQMLDHIARFRDIGKISISPSILDKPSKLTDREYLIVKKHPEIGYRMLTGTKNYSEIAYDVLTHHEYFDGTGYPRGLKGEEIPLRARIIIVAIAYVSMTSDRPYRPRRSHEEAVVELENCKGKMFDPAIVDVFLTLF